MDGLDITGDPSVDRLTVEGPFNSTGVGDTASRKRIFVCRPANTSDELPCARKILSALARNAFRRPVTDTDLETLLSFYQRRRNQNKSSQPEQLRRRHRIGSAKFVLASLWNFCSALKPIPRVQPRIRSIGWTIWPLAARLSFFLWSSIPDEQLLNLASQKKLHDPTVMAQQVKRMLADPKADALISNFAEQWLFLRNLKSSSPNLDAYPDFDDNLRQAMKQETELFFGSIIREDRRRDGSADRRLHFRE